MKNSYIYLASILILHQLNVFAQDVKTRNTFDYLVREVDGDLNNDGKVDRVTVHMDTTDKTLPMKMQIFLSQPNGKLALAVASTQLIEPQYPVEKNGAYNGYQIPSFRIEHGHLFMWREIKGGNITYEFTYQNGNFELIHVEKLTNNSTKGYIDENTLSTEVKFNLVTGVRLETDDTNSDKILENNTRQKNVLIRPLPKLQDLKFSDHDWF